MVDTVNENNSRLLFSGSRVFDRVVLQPARSKLSFRSKDDESINKFLHSLVFPFFIIN